MSTGIRWLYQSNRNRFEAPIKISVLGTCLIIWKGIYKPPIIMFRALLACFLLVSATSLIVPLYNAFPRCMVVFSFGDKETVKIDMKFPQIPHKQGDEAYEIYYKNTDTNETFYEVSGPGQYRKELEVNQNVIYEVCFWYNGNREVGTLKVEYTAMVEFYFKQEHIKVPDNLLKSKDLTETYFNAQKIKEIGDRFEQVQTKRAEIEQASFQETRSVGSTLATLSIVEFVIILVAAAFQLVLLRGFMVKRNYI